MKAIAAIGFGILLGGWLSALTAFLYPIFRTGTQYKSSFGSIFTITLPASFMLATILATAFYHCLQKHYSLVRWALIKGNALFLALIAGFDIFLYAVAGYDHSEGPVTQLLRWEVVLVFASIATLIAGIVLFPASNQNAKS